MGRGKDTRKSTIIQ